MEVDRSLTGNFGLYWDSLSDEYVLAVIKEHRGLNEIIVEDMNEKILSMECCRQYDKIEKIENVLYIIKKQYRSRYS